MFMICIIEYLFCKYYTNDLNQYIFKQIYIYLNCNIYYIHVFFSNIDFTFFTKYHITSSTHPHTTQVACFMDGYVCKRLPKSLSGRCEGTMKPYGGNGQLTAIYNSNTISVVKNDANQLFWWLVYL